MADLRTTKKSKISFHVTLKVRADPTSGTVAFGVTDSKTVPPANFVAGSWDTYNALIGQAEADTPTMGSNSAGIDLTSTTPGRLVLWYRLTVGTEVDELPWDGGFITLIS